MIFLLLWTVISIALYYRLKLPTIKLEAVRERFENNKQTVEKYATRTKKADQHPQPTLFSESASSESSGSSLPSALKSLIKEKVHAKVQKKEDDETMRQLHISFPSDKPTFDINVLGIEQKTGPLVDENRLLTKAEGIKEKLGEFWIDVEIEWFNVGPTVIQFKIKPDSGIKIAKIEALSKDIALALKTKSLRVLAPIPGTDQVGIEIPNPTPKMVRLREVMGGIEFAKAMGSTLTNLAIGISIDGTHMVKDLESMPHLLVAGATGSWKSVSVNDFIVSLIYQNTPSELKFIMVDPKQVELGMYEGIPYLLSPIITEPWKAVKVLKRSVDFMEQRYNKLREAKVRNIAEYNEKVSPSEHMYRLVIIIDELADLMMSGNKKDTETYITRIAQKARAVGIHLILATQRPSVNVITGLIKANVPTRIAFGVVSQIDSRTILDMKGAEDLVGKGDLLYIDPKTKFPLRIQAPYISTAETESIVTSIKRTYMTGISEEDIYHPEIMRILESKGEFASGENVSDDDEDLIEQAMQLIAETRKASATMLQRKLGVGFPRAARLIDILEERGVVWPQEWAKPREIFL